MKDTQKHILIIFYQKLIINGTAGEAVSCGLIEAALNRGYRVTYLGLIPQGFADSNGIRFIPDKNADLLTEESATFAVRKGNRLESLVYYFDHAALQHLTEPCPALERTYDEVIAIDSFAISLGQKVKAKVHIGIIGDPVGQRLWYSTFSPWKQRFIVGTLAWFLELRHFRRKIDPSWKIGIFGHSYSRRCTKILKRPVLDLRPFLRPNNSKGNPSETVNPPSGAPVTIAFGGTLATTASRLSFQFLQDKLLPELRAALGKGRFVFKVIGSFYKDYSSLADQFPEVAMIGRVPIFEKEMEDCDVFVLPMNYPVGVRTRVCSALQAGCYCLCDPSVLLNMPELADCATVKMVRHPRDYAKAISELSLDAESRQQRKQISKAFFAQHYACEVAAKPLLDVLA